MTKVTAEVLPLGMLSEDDVSNFIDWVWHMRHLNMFDKDVLTYPRTVMCRAQAGEDPILYMPLQSVLMYDAIAPKPGLSPEKEALALWRIGQEVDKAAKLTQHREIFFFCKDDRVADACARHGFEELENVRVLRRKQ